MIFRKRKDSLLCGKIIIKATFHESARIGMIGVYSAGVRGGVSSTGQRGVVPVSGLAHGGFQIHFPPARAVVCWVWVWAVGFVAARVGIQV